MSTRRLATVLGAVYLAILLLSVHMPLRDEGGLRVIDVAMAAVLS